MLAVAVNQKQLLSIGSGACPWHAEVAAVPLLGDSIWPAADSYASAGRQWNCSCFAASASLPNNFQIPAPETSINPVKFPALCSLTHTTKRWEIRNDLLRSKVSLAPSRYPALIHTGRSIGFYPYLTLPRHLELHHGRRAGLRLQAEPGARYRDPKRKEV